MILRATLLTTLMRWVVVADDETSPGYGYVGPACAVVDSILFVHGVANRTLSHEELALFHLYQQDLSRFRESAVSGSRSIIAMDAPEVPSFCGGYDDSVEIVLNKCIVRNNHVYIDDRLIRSLTNKERQRLNTALTYRTKHPRQRRNAGMTPQRDLSLLFHKFLNVNSTVTQRFLPVVSQSPLFSMEGTLEEVLGPLKSKFANRETGFLPTSDNSINNRRSVPATANYLSPQLPQTTTEPNKWSPRFSSTKKTTRKARKPTSRSIFSVTPPSPIGPSTSTTQPQMSTTTHSMVERETSRERILVPVYSNNPPKQERRSTVASISVPSSPDEETVSDPVLLQLIAKALASNRLLEDVINQDNTSPPQNSVPYLSSANKIPKQSKMQPSFGQPATWYTPTEPGPAPNLPFVPHQAFTTFVGDGSRPRYKPISKSQLPNDICTAHLRN